MRSRHSPLSHGTSPTAEPSCLKGHSPSKGHNWIWGLWDPWVYPMDRTTKYVSLGLPGLSSGCSFCFLSANQGAILLGPCLSLASFCCVAHRFLPSFQLPYHPVYDFQKFFLSLELSLIFFIILTLPSYPEVESIFCHFSAFLFMSKLLHVNWLYLPWILLIFLLLGENGQPRI